MTTMNIWLPKALKSFVNEQASTRGYSTPSEYVYELVRRDRARQSIRDRLLAGAASPRAGVADARYFDRLRAGIREVGPR